MNSLRSRAAQQVVLTTTTLSKRLGLGGGSVIGGRLGLYVDRNLLSRLAAGRSIALVSGTNGKTTTTRLVTESLGGPSLVATSLAGANMPAGLVAALAQSPSTNKAALEVDENYLPSVVSAVAPNVVVLLNLSRDQLDRVSEVRMIANKWRECFTQYGGTVIANADDPLVVWAAIKASSVIWVSAGHRWREDAFHCPSCDRHITYEATIDSPQWACECGFSRPEPDVWTDDARLGLSDGRTFDLSIALPGNFNRANAAMAAVAASTLGVEIGLGLQRIAPITEIAGRFSTATVGHTAVRLLLAKNPAGWNELIELVAEQKHPAVIAINARIADGRDPSWLWDVGFERLAGRTVCAIGDRRLDLSVRLRHAGIDHRCAENATQAIDALGADAVDFIGNYTAFQDFRRLVAKQTTISHGTTDQQENAVRTAEPVVVPTTAVSQKRSKQKDGDLVVVVVHPDLLGTYGDVGNGRILANRARWRGISVELVHASSEEALPSSADIYCLGGGEDGPQLHAASRLCDGVLSRAVDGGATVLAICAGYQIIGTSFVGPDGRPSDGVGLIDATTVRGRGARAVGDVRATALDTRLVGDDAVLSGFENHAGWTTRGRDVPALAEVVSGVGNGSDRTDGIVVGKIVGSYLHGPFLARNPAVADLLLSFAIGHELAPIDDSEEGFLRSERLGSATQRRKRRVVNR